MAKAAKAPFVPDEEEEEDRPVIPTIIAGELVKCKNGIWQTRDGDPLPPTVEYFVIATFKVAQRWRTSG